MVYCYYYYYILVIIFIIIFFVITIKRQKPAMHGSSGPPSFTEIYYTVNEVSFNKLGVSLQAKKLVVACLAFSNYLIYLSILGIFQNDFDFRSGQNVPAK